MIRQQLLFLICVLLNTALYSQALTGTVVDERNDPLTMVNIVNLSGTDHTHTDENGYFHFSGVEIGDTIRFSHIGYWDKDVFIQSYDAEIKVILKLRSLLLEEIEISSGIDALNMITEIDLQTSPVNSSQDILQKVPGLMIGQHAGGGKAEQIFLRGFDVDHGTDVKLTVDGLPVNMVSHAHGQGYSDLHFIIPETVERIDFGKGPYYAEHGNFNTAGYVNFATKRQLSNSLIRMEAGRFNTFRLLGMLKLINKERHKSYVASEFISTDGPFESPQNFNRINLFGKYKANLTESDRIGVTLSHFSSKWDASGQIPQRAVDNGSISRFGAIDDTEGGNTSRTNVLIDYKRSINDRSFISNVAYFTNYDFELYSNFTFFLEDSVNGDQIRQRESRNIIGFQSEYTHQFSVGNLNGDVKAGVSLRNDQTNDSELSSTLNRAETLENIQLGDINETNVGAYLSTTFNLAKWKIMPSVRLDYFDFQYNDALQPLYQTQSATKAIVSPKLNVLYNYSNRLQFYFKSGMGFHSNDTRVVVAQNGRSVLPAAYGFDVGYIWKPTSKWLVNMAYWYLFLEQEFVYVGDAGIVEPSGKTQRQGVDVSVRYQPLTWLFLDVDGTYTHARSTDEERDADFIPLAPDITLTGGVSVIHPSGFHGGIHFRYLDDRPANEDNSIVAKGYTVVDLNAGYNWKRLEFGIQIQNLLDTEWEETQFATRSRLRNEVQPVEEIHFTPGTPFFIKGSVGFHF